MSIPPLHSPVARREPLLPERALRAGRRGVLLRGEQRVRQREEQERHPRDRM